MAYLGYLYRKFTKEITMIIGTVEVMSPAENERFLKETTAKVAKYDTAKRDFQKKVEEYVQVLHELGDEMSAIAQAGIASGQARIAKADAEIAKNNAEIAKNNYTIYINTICRVVFNHFAPSDETLKNLSEEAKVKLQNESAAEARKFVIKHTSQSQIDSPEIFMSCDAKRCMRLKSGTTLVILSILAKLGLQSIDLRSFKNEFDPLALEMLLKSPIKEFTFDESVKGTGVEKTVQQIQAEKTLKAFLITKNGKVEMKTLSLAISTSTSSSASPIVTKKNEGNSPDNSPPKVLQATKPLPVPPAKALPKPPAPRILQAK